MTGGMALDRRMAATGILREWGMLILSHSFMTKSPAS
jgi:hypothetical protein